MTDWEILDGAIKALAITGGALGVVSFVWTLWDRIDRRKATSPFAEVEIYIANKTADGWIPVQLRFKNRWDEPLVIETVKLRRGVFAMSQRSPALMYSPDETRVGRALSASWPVRPVADDKGEAWSARAVVYIKDGSFGNESLNNMLFTLRAITPSRRAITMKPSVKINRISAAEAGKK